MDANIENNNEDEQQQAQVQAQVEQEQAVVLLKKMILVLEQKETFPFQTRNKTDELVENFLEQLEDDVHDMLCDNIIDADNYRGLDSDRDTEAEVEAILRFFPEVLSRQKELVWDEEDHDEYRLLSYPIEFLAFTRHGYMEWTCNMKAASFIPLVVRLAIELGLFEEQDRGGLLCENNDENNILQYLISSDSPKHDNQERHELVDTKNLQVLIQLRKMGYLKKEDIQMYHLLMVLSSQIQRDYFADKRFRFLVEWDPNALWHPNRGWLLPIDYVAYRSSIRGFQIVFEYGIRYFPKKKGINLLFRKTNYGCTPFQQACERLGCEKVMEVVDDTLARCSTSSDNTPPLIIEEALITAAIDENIHLDGVYFLIRRQPDILQKLLSSSSSSSSSMSVGNEKIIGTNDDENDKLDKTKTNPEKRKRKEKMNEDDNA
jgi:hypothetical protein